jgi:RNase H-like domain found in reverse transcriptase
MLAESGFNKKQQRQWKAHIENFSQKWGSKQRDARTDLKSDLSSPTMLAPKREPKKKVMTDASTYDIGAVLLQE